MNLTILLSVCVSQRMKVPPTSVIRMVTEESNRLHKPREFHMLSFQQPRKSVPADWVVSMKLEHVKPNSMHIRAALTLDNAQSNKIVSSCKVREPSNHDLDVTHHEQESLSITSNIFIKMFISIILPVCTNQISMLFGMFGLIFPGIQKIKRCISSKCC